MAFILHGRWLGVVCICWLLALPIAVLGAETLAAPAVIESNYNFAWARYQTNNSPEAAWKFAAACFDRAEFSSNSTQRASLAHDGMAAAKHAVSRKPDMAAGHYYLALNLAQLARTKLWGALPLLGQMEREWNLAEALNEHLDYAGPDRYVGQLYRDAPGWPLSLGDKAKARKHLEHAVTLAPEFPENNLNLIETYLEWKERDHARNAMEKLEALLPEARQKFTGDYWDVSWKDWEKRLETLRKMLADPQASTNRPPRLQ